MYILIHIAAILYRRSSDTDRQSRGDKIGFSILNGVSGFYQGVKAFSVFRLIFQEFSIFSLIIKYHGHWTL